MPFSAATTAVDSDRPHCVGCIGLVQYVLLHHDVATSLVAPCQSAIGLDHVVIRKGLYCAVNRFTQVTSSFRTSFYLLLHRRHRLDLHSTRPFSVRLRLFSSKPHCTFVASALAIEYFTTISVKFPHFGHHCLAWRRVCRWQYHLRVGLFRIFFPSSSLCA